MATIKELESAGSIEVMIDARTPTARRNTAMPMPSAISGANRGRYERIIGVMLESHLKVAGSRARHETAHGQSITDACIGWDTTVDVLSMLAESVRARRLMVADGA